LVRANISESEPESTLFVSIVTVCLANLSMLKNLSMLGKSKYAWQI